MRIEDRLRSELRRERTPTPPEEAWESIRRRLEAGPRHGTQRIVATALALVLAAVAIGTVVIALPRAHRSHEVNNGLQQLPVQLLPIGYANVPETAYSVAADGV